MVSKILILKIFYLHLVYTVSEPGLGFGLINPISALSAVDTFSNASLPQGGNILPVNGSTLSVGQQQVLPLLETAELASKALTNSALSEPALLKEPISNLALPIRSLPVPLQESMPLIPLEPAKNAATVLPVITLPQEALKTELKLPVTPSQEDGPELDLNAWLTKQANTNSERLPSVASATPIELLQSNMTPLTLNTGGGGLEANTGVVAAAIDVRAAMVTETASLPTQSQ